jgi:hypothetical protein
MSVVAQSSGAMFIFGYTVAAKAAIESLFRFVEKHPMVSCGVGAATAFWASISPELAIQAAQYIIVGGSTRVGL